MYFSEKEYDKAIEKYTNAIDLDPENAIYFANRSLAHLRLESFGFALQDAVSAVKSDPKYLKGYYRRAAAYMSLGKFKLALKDFELVRRSNNVLSKFQCTVLRFNVFNFRYLRVAPQMMTPNQNSVNVTKLSRNRLLKELLR